MKGQEWEEMRESPSFTATSVSAIKWTFVKLFSSAEECFNHLEKNNFISYGTSPHILGKTNVSLDQGKFTQKKLAVWFGTETSGMSEYSINRCKGFIQIPMAGIIESLNLSVSTGIVLYEITKQRRQFTKNKMMNKTKNKK
jgi:tRNA (guanosine-2'-O-)-methyltransferase